MDMHWLEDVLTLLEEGNMSRAAARRNITQPAFSRRIRSFETWLGTDVLTRGSNRIDIAEALAANEDEIRALVDRLRDLKSRIARFDLTASNLAMAAQHALISSVFSDIALRTRRAFPAMRFRLRAANQNDCISMFLRGDVDMLLSYETETTGQIPFDTSVRRELWGTDQLIPVVGGEVRYIVRANGSVPEDTPAIVYPLSSYFGQVLRSAQRDFGTIEHAANPICESAFSNGLFEMVRRGLGVGWLPHSMCYHELERGSLVSLGQQYGQVPLLISLYSNREDPVATLLQDQIALRASLR